MDIDLQQREIKLPVSVVLERKLVKGDFWESPVWSLDSVLVGEKLSYNGAAGTELPDSGNRDGRTRHLWNGYTVRLYRDACERYWHALIGNEPKVYVVLEKDEIDGTVEPWLVTIDYDEATAHTEIDAEVVTAPIPGELYVVMEQYVLQHYKPVPFKKRKRKNWSADENSVNPNGDKPDQELSPWDERRRFRRRGYHG